MPISPLCLVQNGASPYTSTLNGVDVTPNNTISIKLDDTTGVADWYLEFVGSDELAATPVLANVDPFTHKVLTPAAIASFAMENATGRALLFKSTVVGALGSVETTFSVYTLTAQGRRVAAAGETLEGDAGYGWAATLNPIIRSGALILPYDDSLTAPPIGVTTIQQAIDVLKITGGTPSGPAGGDLTGNYPNPTIADKDGLPGVASMRTLGTGSQQACAGDDSRLSDARAPTGSAGGSLSGTYPNPTIAAGVITDVQVSNSNKDGIAGLASMRTLGTGGQQACAGNDSRLSDARTPTGSAGGSLSGTYPNPTIAAGAITDVEVAAANKDGLATVASLRTLGTGGQQACAGNDSRLSDARTPTGAAGGDLSSNYPTPTVSKIQGVSASAPTAGNANQVLLYNHSGPSLVWGATPLHYELPLYTNLLTSTSAIPTRLAARIIDLSLFPSTFGTLTRKVRLNAILDAVSGTTTLKLMDVSLMSPTVLTNATLAWASTPSYVASASPIPVGDAAGSIWVTSPTTHIYELTLESTGVGSCSGAWITITYE